MKSLFVLACLLFSSALAQTLTGSLYGSSFRFEPDLRLSQIDLGEDIELNARLALGIRNPIEFGVGLRTARSFGPVGNLVVTGGADVSTAGAYDVGIAAEGVVALGGAERKAGRVQYRPRNVSFGGRICYGGAGLSRA